MSAKRFNSILYEDFCRVITDNGKEINPLQVVELLNELHEENEQLKNRLDKVLKELYCKDRKLEELGEDIECCDEK